MREGAYANDAEGAASQDEWMRGVHLYSDRDDPIMTEAEQSEIVAWVRSHYQYFRPNGPRQFMQRLDYLDDVPDCVWDIKRRIYDRERLHGYDPEPLYRDSVGYMLDGGFLHLHSDPNPDDGSGRIHTRFNVYVQLPERGGYPIYADIPCRLRERTYICCRAGIDKHRCATVQGPRERIILSFGVLAPRARVERVVYAYGECESETGADDLTRPPLPLPRWDTPC
jgi:hypothetical protein